MNEYEQQIIKDSDKIIAELGAKDVYEALRMVKENEWFYTTSRSKTTKSIRSKHNRWSFNQTKTDIGR